MRLRVGLLLASLLAAALVLGLLPGRLPDRGQLTDGGGSAAERDRQPRQTSDGEPGEIAVQAPPYLRSKPRIDHRRSWRMAPGVRFERWDQTDYRGRIRAYLVRVNPQKRGVSLDYGHGGEHVPDRATVTEMLGREGATAVAGVNGGFFDINDTGAPLGVGQDRQQGFLHAAKYTWNNAFWMDQRGRPTIGVMPLSAQILEFPQLELTNVNSPRARAGNIGVWDPRWGSTSGYSITDGQHDGVRMVVVEDGRVVANTTNLSSGKEITGTVLVGRGPGADQLAQLRVGARATLEWGLTKQPAFAISGESILLRRGKIKVSDDRILHPRTAVGIDRDHGTVMLLVVDGRQRRSRGYTLVEMARLMKKLGAETALNLDGGGSSTMAGRNRQGELALLNRPSDGSQRRVGDGIAVLYDAP